MATTTINNTGNLRRFETAGLLLIDPGGGTDYSPLYIEPGTLKVKEGKTQAIPVMDKGVLTADIYSGDEQPSEITFSVRPTKNGLTSATDLLTLLCPSDTSGKRTTYSVIVKMPDSAGASAGVTATLTRGYVPEGGIEYNARSGANHDLVNVTIRFNDPSIAWATY